MVNINIDHENKVSFRSSIIFKSIKRSSDLSSDYYVVVGVGGAPSQSPVDTPLLALSPPRCPHLTGEARFYEMS